MHYIVSKKNIMHYTTFCTKIYDHISATKRERERDNDTSLFGLT